MMRNKLLLGACFLVVLILLTLPGLAKSCRWSGTLRINGIYGDSVMVTAYDNGTGEFLASGWEIEEKGEYFIELNATDAGYYVFFRVMGIPADQGPQLCEAWGENELDLTATACRDCDGDGFDSLFWGGDDCNDRDPDINPEEREICGNWIDEDCDGLDMPCSGCIENWTCTVWSGCVGGEQTRMCEDLNDCGTTLNMPAQVQVCSIYGAGIVCNDGDLVCEKDRVLECFAGEWRSVETCEFGCYEGACSPGGIAGFMAANPVAFYGMVVVIIIVLAGAVYRKTRW